MGCYFLYSVEESTVTHQSAHYRCIIVDISVQLGAALDIGSIPHDCKTIRVY